MNSLPPRRWRVALRAIASSGALIGFAAALRAQAPQPASPQTTPAQGAPHGPTAGKTEELSLAVGETRTITARDVKNYSLGLADIVDVRITPDNNQFVVVGKHAGSTTLLLIKNDGSRVTYDINVTSRSEGSVARELDQLLEGTTGVVIRRVGSRFFLEGSVGTEAELHRMQQIAGLYPGQVESLVTVGGGSATDRRQLIRVDFFFVQYDANSSYAVGLAWPTAIGGDAVVQNTFTYDFLGKTTTTAQASIVNQPLPRLDIASRNGWAKIMRQASMLTANGMEANFDSGGEQNYSVNTGLTIGLQKVSFGTIITALPRYDSKTGQIDIKIVSDVSDLTAAVSSNIPGRIFSRLTTNVTLKLGQGLVLSGLHSQAQTHAVAGLPVLSQLPLIGVLFGSHSDNQLETQNAIFVIPSVVESVPSSSLAMIGKAMREYDDYSGKMRRVAPFNPTPPSAR
jgi:pilus assembly protein CpaC